MLACFNYVGTAIIRPLFCIARRMRADGVSRRFRKGRKVALQLSMQHIKGSEHPDWQPLQEDLDHSQSVMELFYYRKDVRCSSDPDQAELRTAETLRRKRGDVLRKRFHEGDRSC